MKAIALRKALTFATPGFEDKIRDARYLVGEDRFVVTFESGKEYTLRDGRPLAHYPQFLTTFRFSQGFFSNQVRVLSVG